MKNSSEYSKVVKAREQLLLPEQLHRIRNIPGSISGGGEGNLYSKAHLNWFYLLASLASILLVAFYVIKYLNFSSVPVEDAAMLMRYALHFAQGYGIVWNTGARPVDGGTDFLYMVVLAGLVKLGLTVEISARFVDIVSHLLTVVLIYFAIMKLTRGGRWLALLSAVYLAVGPGLVYSAAYFGTTFFALFACITWYLANKLVQEGESHLTSMLFALAALTMGLIRPEGVLLAIFMLCAILYMKGFKNSRRILSYFLLTFLTLGGTYFLWRWHYFGYPLPNPFYKKGGGHLYVSGLWTSIRTVLSLCGPFSFAILIGLRSYKTVRQTVFLLIPTLGFTLIWILLSPEMNYLGRFQYAVLPLILMSWPSLVEGFPKDLKFPSLKALDKGMQIVLLALTVCICFAILWYPHTLDKQEDYFRDGRYDMATLLRGYSNKHYVMATSEAGLLPLYSNWQDVDTWGLNDQWIAHHSLITQAYLDTYKPEIIMFHASFSPVVPVKDNFPREEWTQNWFPMLMTLKAYAESHGYILAAAFGISPYDTHYYYVRPNFPESASIIEKIRSIDYYWYASGEKCINYALS